MTRTRKIDTFLLRMYKEYCTEKRIYNECADQLDYTNFVKQNGQILIARYKAECRATRGA
jgi:hypothetical protein